MVCVASPFSEDVGRLKYTGVTGVVKDDSEKLDVSMWWMWFKTRLTRCHINVTCRSSLDQRTMRRGFRQF